MILQPFQLEAFVSFGFNFWDPGVAFPQCKLATSSAWRVSCTHADLLFAPIAPNALSD